MKVKIKPLQVMLGDTREDGRVIGGAHRVGPPSDGVAEIEYLDAPIERMSDRAIITVERA